MGNKIIVCGGNGAGKSTLGIYLASQLGCKFLDIEDYYFPENQTERPYETARTREEVSRDLLADLNKCENCVFAAVKGNYGQEVEALFTCAVFIEVPSELRSARVRERSYQKFGDRIFPGGDLYEKEKRFFEMVDRRSAKDVEEWLRAVRLPTIRVDGTKTKEYNAALIVEALRKKETSSVFKL